MFSPGFAVRGILVISDGESRFTVLWHTGDK